MYKLRSALIVSGWLLATSGGAEAQSSQNANAAPYNSAVGFGVGLDKIDLLEGGSAGLTYFMGNYRFNFWDDEGGDTNVFERRRQRLRGYAEVEAGYWKDSELRPFTSDFLIGVNALAVASAGSADVFFGGGFGAHFLKDETGQNEDATELGANLQFGIDLNLSQGFAVFTLGRFDLLTGNAFDAQTKIIGGVRAKF